MKYRSIRKWICSNFIKNNVENDDYFLHARNLEILNILKEFVWTENEKMGKWFI